MYNISSFTVHDLSSTSRRPLDLRHEQPLCIILLGTDKSTGFLQHVIDELHLAAIVAERPDVCFD